MGTEPVPTGQDDAADPVRELQRRVKRARVTAPVAFEHDYYRPLALALANLDHFLNGHAESAAPDPLMQRVARVLIGEGITYTEWCVYWDADDPNACSFMPTQDGVGELWTCDELDEATRMRQIITDDGRIVGGIAQRQVTVYRTPWQVVDTEGGERNG